MKIDRFFSNTRNLLKLAYPILIAQLIQNLMGFADTVMAGRVSATDMAAFAEAEKNKVELPMTKIVDGFYQEIQENGGNRWDTSSLISRFK